MTSSEHESSNTWALRLVAGLVATHLGVEPSSIRAEDRLQEDLGLDSLDLAELVVCLYEETGLDIELDSPEDLGGLATVGEVARVVLEKQAVGCPRT